MKRIFDDNGIKHVELEFLTDRFLDGEQRRRSDKTKQMLMIAAEVLGARHIKVGNFDMNQVPMPRLVESFAAICAEGEFDVKGFVSRMLKAGYKGPWGIEVLSKDLRKLSLNEAATRAFNTTMVQFSN